MLAAMHYREEKELTVGDSTPYESPSVLRG